MFLWKSPKKSKPGDLDYAYGGQKRSHGHHDDDNDDDDLTDEVDIKLADN